jgi:hypothetical protein
MRMVLLVLASLALISPLPAADTLVVCPEAFRPSLEPWVAHRAGQGHSLVFLPPAASADELAASIRATARSHALKFVVLVGDCDPQAAADPKLQACCIPTKIVPAKIIRKLGEDENIATDNEFADLDGDGIPDLAVGRLPADTPQELALIVRKILQYEAQRGGAWRRRINFVAGLGGFGQLADAALEMGAKKFITENIPPEFACTMTYGSWQSPYCPDPRRFHEATIEGLNQGCLFWVYIGHGSRRNLDWIRTPDERNFEILDCRHIPKLTCNNGPPIALFMACYTAAFDQPEDCLAEELLRREGGPVAIVGGSRVTMPYAMGVLGVEMLRECFAERRPTIGEVFCNSKRGLVLRPRDDPDSKTLDFLASMLNIHNDLPAERAEHLSLFNLIGDPLLRIPRPALAKVQAPATARPGDELQVSGHCELDGEASLELVVRRDRLTFEPPHRRQFDPSPAVLAEYNKIYQKANQHGLAAWPVTVKDGQFQARITVPPQAQGKCHVRLFLDGPTGTACGAADIEIQPPAAKAP